MPPNSFIEWVIGQNIPRSRLSSGQRKVLEFELSTDELTDTLRLRVPRKSSKQTPASAVDSKKVSLKEVSTKSSRSSQLESDEEDDEDDASEQIIMTRKANGNVKITKGTRGKKIAKEEPAEKAKEIPAVKVEENLVAKVKEKSAEKSNTKPQKAKPIVGSDSDTAVGTDEDDDGALSSEPACCCQKCQPPPSKKSKGHSKRKDNKEKDTSKSKTKEKPPKKSKSVKQESEEEEEGESAEESDKSSAATGSPSETEDEPPKKSKVEPKKQKSKNDGPNKGDTTGRGHDNKKGKDDKKAKNNEKAKDDKKSKDGMRAKNEMKAKDDSKVKEVKASQELGSSDNAQDKKKAKKNYAEQEAQDITPKKTERLPKRLPDSVKQPSPDTRWPRLAEPPYAKVMQMEHVVEDIYRDPQPNAFVDDRNDVCRVYEGPYWSNHRDALYPRRMTVPSGDSRRAPMALPDTQHLQRGDHLVPPSNATGVPIMILNNGMPPQPYYQQQPYTQPPYPYPPYQQPVPHLQPPYHNPHDQHYQYPSNHHPYPSPRLQQSPYRQPDHQQAVGQPPQIQRTGGPPAKAQQPPPQGPPVGLSGIPSDTGSNSGLKSKTGDNVGPTAPRNSPQKSDRSKGSSNRDRKSHNGSSSKSGPQQNAGGSQNNYSDGLPKGKAIPEAADAWSAWNNFRTTVEDNDDNVIQAKNDNNHAEDQGASGNAAIDNWDAQQNSNLNDFQQQWDSQNQNLNHSHNGQRWDHGSSGKRSLPSDHKSQKSKTSPDSQKFSDKAMLGDGWGTGLNDAKRSSPTNQDDCTPPNNAGPCYGIVHGSGSKESGSRGNGSRASGSRGSGSRGSGSKNNHSRSSPPRTTMPGSWNSPIKADPPLQEENSWECRETNGNNDNNSVNNNSGAWGHPPDNTGPGVTWWDNTAAQSTQGPNNHVYW